MQSTDMSFMYDPALRQQAVAEITRQGMSLTGDNVARAMALMHQGAGPLNVRAAGDATKTGDMLTQYMNKSGVGGAQTQPEPTQAELTNADGGVRGSTPASVANATPPAIGVRSPQQSGGVAAQAATPDAALKSDDPELAMNAKLQAADMPLRAEGSTWSSRALDNLIDGIPMALMGLAPGAGAIPRAVGAGMKMLEGPSAMKLLQGPAEAARLAGPDTIAAEAPAAQAQLSASPGAKRAGAIELIAERLKGAMMNMRPPTRGTSYSNLRTMKPQMAGEGAMIPDAYQAAMSRAYGG